VRQSGRGTFGTRGVRLMRLPLVATVSGRRQAAHAPRPASTAMTTNGVTSG
jgi:hypothetical protein